MILLHYRKTSGIRCYLQLQRSHVRAGQKVVISSFKAAELLHWRAETLRVRQAQTELYDPHTTISLTPHSGT
jgi:hypothetical protein